MLLILNAKLDTEGHFVLTQTVEGQYLAACAVQSHKYSLSIGIFLKAGYVRDAEECRDNTVRAMELYP